MPTGKYSRPVRPVIIPIGPSIAYVELTQGLYSLIDYDDAEKVGKFNWCAQLKKHTGRFYAMRETRNIDGSTSLLQLHSFLVGSIADHKNLNTLDNRSCNLRAATALQNSQNRTKYKNNTSGYKGVYWHKRRHRWTASIMFDGKRTHLGSFSDPITAHRAYAEAAAKYAGEFARAE